MQEFDDWIRNFMARPGILKTTQAAWLRAKGPQPAKIEDFWDGSFIRTLLGPDGHSRFADVPAGEARLAFSLAVDWFNPYHNKTAGKSCSTGVVFLTCLNLPIKERYKEENVYLVGVLPSGAHQGQLNDVLEPFVQNLLQYWTQGKTIVGAFEERFSVLLRLALCQLVADAPASRVVSGFPGHAATYGCCTCKDDVNKDYELESIVELENPRTREDHLQHAEQYRSTLHNGNLHAAEKLVNGSNGPNGVRWSVLNLLPYWDPIKCTVVDCMHCILLGICRRHWRCVWDADLLEKSSGVIADPNEHTKSKQREQSEECVILQADVVKDIRKHWVKGNEATLKKLAIPKVLFLLKENNATLPSSYEDKEELTTLLMVGLYLLFGLFIFTDKRTKNTRLKYSFPAQAASNRRIVQKKIPERQQIGPGQLISPSEVTLSSGKDEDAVVSILPKRSDARESFITKEELLTIQKTISESVVPSNFTKIRSTFGEKSNGKLKADEWRSVFTVYLPMAFLILWYNRPERMLHLKNLLYLTILIYVVVSRTSSQQAMDLYVSSVLKYLRLTLVLYPHHSLTINHHSSLHIPFYVDLHGPCHSHWAFPTERLIGRMQKIRLNNHMG
jgi:hypothetical protein